MRYYYVIYCYCCLCRFSVVFSDWFLFFIFFCKEKTAYEMRISDSSSDVCSSDLKGISNAELRALSGLESVQASRTLAALAEKFPGAIEIDRSEKRWQLSDLRVARELGGGLDEYMAMVMGANLEKGWLHDARTAFINPVEVSMELVRPRSEEH